MKKKFILLLCLILACVGLAGCSSGQSNVSPQDAIKEVYGNSEFRISFNANGLDAPLDDITYSAYKIPALPTPERIGYIFAGWYLDAEYTIPYTDGILYLYMTDVTLYAKWEKESFVQNGIYDVEYSATILEDTVKKGELTDRYGGYKDFTKSLIENEIYLEKSDDRLLLKLQYDTERTLPMMSNLQVYSVKISSKNGSDVYIDSKIDSYADPIKTVFINLGNFNLENTLYLDVQTSNWEENLSDMERQKTTTKYTVAFDFTRIIGFSKPYADINVPLDEGYYLAKSYYKKITGEESMSASFNPVYSYIYSDGENYTLIKQNIPYGGLASLNASTLAETAKNYYSRLMSLIPTMLYYEITSPPQGEEEVESDWYPSEYGALYYGNYAVEYHADTGKFYNIFDLGNSVKKSFVVMSAATGFMEVASGMSYSNQILTIDYEHIVKLASVDYKPLSGDAYQYQSKMQYYPGDEKDLKQKGLNYEIMMENGLSTDMVNFFFSTQNLDLPTSSRTQYSSRITVTPTVGTNAKTVADSRYVMANFDVNSQVFGYDVRSNEELYADVMTVQKMGSTGMRRNIRIATGKSCKVGETIRLSEIYAEKCNGKEDFSQVSYKAYAMTAGKVDFGNEIDLQNSAFTFERDMAVVLETDNGSGKNYTVVELVMYEEPTVEILNTEEFPYEPDAVYVVGDEISYPYLTYSWMGRSDVMIDDYYESASSGTGEIKRGVSPVKTAVFKIDGDDYDLSETPHYQANKFTIPFKEFAVVYELTNKYGELYHYFIPFSSKGQTKYHIENAEGETCFENFAKYDKTTGERLAISHSFGTEILSADTFAEQFGRTYRFVIGESTVNIPLVSYDIYSNIEQQNYPHDNANLIWDKIKDCEYAVIRLNYSNVAARVKVRATFVFGVTFNGSSSPYSLNYSDYFVGREYTFGIPKLYSSAGALVTNGTAKISASGKHGSLKIDGSQYRLKFYEPGKYTMNHSFSLGNITLSFDQEINVWRDTTDVSITYVTDAEHPFDDGTLERTVTYSLAEDIYTLKKNAFSSSIATTDVLYGWTATLGGYASRAYRSGEVLTDFIGDFNAKNVTLYAFWDPGLTLTVNAGEGTVYTQTYYLNSRGYYDINLELFSVNTPQGYEFVGWRGKMFGDSVYNYQNYSIHAVDWSDPDYGEITAVFKKLYTVKFYVDPTYSNAFFRNEIVLDGEKIKDVSTKQNISCKVDGYRFAGWYVQGDETQTVIDLATFVITGDVTLVAKFVPTEGSAL